MSPFGESEEPSVPEGQARSRFKYLAAGSLHPCHSQYINGPRHSNEQRDDVQVDDKDARLTGEHQYFADAEK